MCLTQADIEKKRRSGTVWRCHIKKTSAISNICEEKTEKTNFAHYKETNVHSKYLTIIK